MPDEFLASVLESADVAVLACETHGNIVVANRAARKLFGGDVLPRNHPLFRALETGTALTVEFAAVGVSGVETNVLVSAKPLLDGDGNRIGAIATCAPLASALETQRGQAEEAKKRLELLLESTGEGVYEVDLEDRCTFTNGSAAAMLGYRREDLLGRRMHELIHHTDSKGQPRPLADCAIHRVLRDGRGCQIDDESFFRADGSSFPVEYSAFPILEAGAVCGAVVTFVDVSARRRIEAALHESETKYRTLFETVSEGIYQTSPNGELLGANRALVEMLGYDSENELRAQDVSDLYAVPQERERLTAKLETEGRLVDVELLLKRKDGRIIRVIENARAVRDERTQVIYYEGTLTLPR
ncbi:MAG: PAS domain S-box protein [Acidobacteriia bacterium]|nr:PAS domain S-box protein [Terriglobia bacterium]